MSLRDKAWHILSMMVAAALAIEGMVVLTMMQDVTIEGTGPIPASDMMLFGVLLLAVGAAGLAFGAMALFKPELLEDGTRLAIASKLIMVIGGIAVAIEGLLWAFMSGRTTVAGLGTFEMYVVAAFAGQIFLLGTSVLWLELITPLEFKLSRFFMYFAGLVAAAQGVVIIGVADETYIEGLGGILERTVVIAGAQLLIVGLAFLVSCYLVDRGSRGMSVLSIIRLATGALIIVEGLAITVLATNVTPEQIGTLTTRTIVIAGMQLALFGFVGLLASGAPVTSASHRWGKASFMASMFLIFLLPVAFLTVGKFW